MGDGEDHQFISNEGQCKYECSSSSFYWASVANAPNVLQPYWLTVLPLDVPDLTASLLL